MRLFHSCDYRDGRIGECGLELIGFGHGCERGEQFVGVIHEPYGAFVLRRCSAVVGGPFAVRLACEPDGAATGFIETAGAAEQQIGFAASACANHGDVAVSYVKECGGDEYTVVAQSKGTWCHASRCGAVKSSLPACGASGAENKGEGLVVPLNADAVLMACTKESMSWTALQRKGTVR